jgi:hypothetical protein
VAHIAVVDEAEKVLFDRYVKPEEPVFSHLTQLTGITEEHLSDAESFDTVMADLRKILDPASTVVVGQGIEHDLAWLKLECGPDIKSFVNVANIFRVRRPDKRPPTPKAEAAAGAAAGAAGAAGAAEAAGAVGAAGAEEKAAADETPVVEKKAKGPNYIYFSLRHTVMCLLGVDMQENEHSPIKDAQYAMNLFVKYRTASPEFIGAIQQTLRGAPVSSFIHFIQAFVVHSLFRSFIITEPRVRTGVHPLYSFTFSVIHYAFVH